MGSIDHIQNNPMVKNSVANEHLKKYYNLSAERDPKRRQELTNLYLNEDMDKKILQKKGRFKNM